MNNLVIDEHIPDNKNCVQCDELIAIKSKFCKHCGNIQLNDTLVTHDQKWGTIKELALFYSFDIFICCIGSFVDVFKTFAWSVAIDILLAIIAVTFFCDKWIKNRSVLAWPNFSLLKLLCYTSAAIIGSIIVSYIAGWLNQALFSSQSFYYGIYAPQKYGKFLMLFFVAVMPAIFEELAYRGYLLNKLNDIVDTRQAIFISAFLFAIIHMSIISLFWMIPFALLLGHLCIKEKTIWYGIFVHFAFNLTACLVELYQLYGFDNLLSV